MITENQKEEILARAINTWGNVAQIEMLNEESTELALATRKYLRNPNGDTRKQVNSEIADVLILIRQWEMMHPGAIEEIQDESEFKMDRLKRRLDKKDFEAN